MGKQTMDDLMAFKHTFDRLSARCGKSQFLTYYFMAAHPGCTLTDMTALKGFTRDRLNISPEQVQIFTPTPSTYATLMYCTEQDPFTGTLLFVEKNPARKQRQKEIVTARPRPGKNSSQENIPARSHGRDQTAEPGPAAIRFYGEQDGSKSIPGQPGL